MARTAGILFLAAIMHMVVSANLYAQGIGDKAPDFTAQSDKGEVRLSQYLGERNVIIAFYFAINTPA